MNSGATIAEATAYDIQMNASRWVIARRALENWTQEDQSRLDAWLNESTAHLVAYWRANHTWNRTYRVAALKQSLPAKPARRFKPMALRMAASLAAIAILGGAASFFLLGPKYATYTTPVGGHEILKLSDGSRIELNTDSVLRLSRRIGQREAILDKGEAYFEIRHDDAHPFIVQAGGRRITDIGTKFIVRNGPGRLEVALVEGRVLLSAPKGTNKSASDLTAGYVAIATANSTSITQRSPVSLQTELSWRRGVLVFHHTTLADATAQFNRYNTHKLAVAGPAAAKLTIDGKFRATDVEIFTEVAEDVLHLHIEEQDGRTVMSR